jgi:Family of unknown function (DUF6519)/Carboxypeptidase regulatory-like domain
VKKDASRDTFHPEKHYRLVLMQQGRVQLDADWNEQGDILTHRIETETLDVIGTCGAPIDDAGFEIITALRPIKFDPTKTRFDERLLSRRGATFSSGSAAFPTIAAGNFFIGAGRFYAGGLLCINEVVTSYLTQPDLPSPPPITEAGLYIVYLDVWQRHITALDDPSIREVALGGPDTATRDKNVWQVKVLKVAANGTCATHFAEWDALNAPPSGRLAARARKEQTSTNPCIVPPGAGYRGLENQLYRVEVHDGGDALDIGSAAAHTVAVTRVPGSRNQLTVPAGGSWRSGGAVEFVSAGSTNPLNGTLAHASAFDGGTNKITLDADVSAFDFTDIQLRPVAATYKWSRDNGSVVTAIENIDNFDVTVHDLGPDDVLGFDVGQWVEVIDDTTELQGRPGVLARIVNKDRALRLLTLSVAPPPLVKQNNKPDLSAHPKLRRWDGIGAIKREAAPVDDHDLELESGVVIRFTAGSYRTGDYWTIPARTATADAQSGNIEWPADASGNALAQPPSGIAHHYCRLATLRWNGAQFDAADDCRKLFPPLTELTTFVYIGGDGQESLPGDPLLQPLEAAVFNGGVPVEDEVVRFTTGANARLAATLAGLSTSTVSALDVRTGSDGIAKCFWKLNPDVTVISQLATAEWLDSDRNTLAAIPFNANLSIADQVFYDPGNCGSLQGRGTVQKAIDRLSRLVSLYEIGGNNQVITPGASLQLTVVAASRCGVVAGRPVSFRIVSGSGTVTPNATTGANGQATATWTPDPTTQHQEVEASIDGDGTIEPKTVRFTANLATVDSGIHVTKITTTADGIALENDQPAVVDRLARGITIEFDANVSPLSSGNAPDIGKFPQLTPDKPTCLLVIDVPYPLGPEASFWGVDSPFAYRPLIVAANVEAKGTQMQWTPTPLALRWLVSVFTRLGNFTDRLLAHLTLKGNFIWSNEKPPRYLDGDVFGIESAGRTGITLPSGDGRKGGDLEMWFWLEPLVIPVAGNPTIVVDPAGTLNRTIRGRVNDPTGAALPGITVTLTLQTPNAGIPPRSVVTDASGNFNFGVVPAAGVYTVSATIGGKTISQQVQILGPPIP